MSFRKLSRPSPNCLISSQKEWTAVSTGGFEIFLQNSNGFNEFFSFQNQLVFIQISSTGQTLYVFDDKHIFHRKSLTQSSSTFTKICCVPFITVPLLIAPYSKSVYIIAENIIASISPERNVHSYHLTESISCCAIVETIFAKGVQLLPQDSPVRNCVVAGLKNGALCSLSFPDSLSNPHQDISHMIQAQGESVSLIIASHEYLVVIGSHGSTVCASLTEITKGTLPYPVSHAFISEHDLLFVFRQQLFIVPLANLNSFKPVHQFTAKIACLSQEMILTTAGILMNYKITSPVPISNISDEICFSINTLHHIADDGIELQKKIDLAAQSLESIQLIRHLQNNHKIFDSSLSLEVVSQPNKKINVYLIVKLNPKHSTNGLSFTAAIQRDESHCEMLSLICYDQNKFIWKIPIEVYSPLPFTATIIASYLHSIDASSVICSKMFDLFDFSLPASASDLSHSNFSLKFPVQSKISSLPNNIFITPFHDHWAFKYSESMCVVIASSSPTCHCAKTAIMRKSFFSGNSKIYSTDNAVIKLFSDLERLQEKDVSKIELAESLLQQAKDLINQSLTEN